MYRVVKQTPIRSKLPILAHIGKRRRTLSLLADG
jgi:hypothetical protein